jgi:hypothetical protein
VRTKVAAHVAALALVTGGCTDDDATTSDFVTAAESVCADANDAVRALGPEPPILTPRQAAWILELTRLDRSAVDRVEALPVPPSERRTIDRMLVQFRAGLEQGEVIARSSRAGDDEAFRAAVTQSLRHLGAAQLDALALGLSECARLGRVSRGG